MNPEREKKLRYAASRRQNLAVILENVTDVHNIGAVLRTCDSVGVKEVFILYSDTELNPKNVKLGKKTSAGGRKWLEIYHYNDLEMCFAHVRRHYSKIYSTHLAADSKSLYALDLTEPVALLFGSEHAGVSTAALAQCDANFVIPQVGMVQSLNISVSCAISLYETYRQRAAKGMYEDHRPFSEAHQEATFQLYYERSKTKNRMNYVELTEE
jgi:tRNA (guanosine-2'-O-)-methyltransferase